MKSISVKVVVWSLLTLVLSLAAFMKITQSVVGRSVADGFQRMDRFFFLQAREAYERGGTAELRHFLSDVHAHMRADYYLTDANGKDLLDGQDRSPMLGPKPGQRRTFQKIGERLALSTESPDGRYRFIVFLEPPFPISNFIPYYLLLLAVVGLLFWAMSFHIVAPLRRLAHTVQLFGRGDLAVRVRAKRKDEIGALSQAFDEMADRIQTLLMAERRLLQDVSHELRSPLARLNFAAELVRKAPDRDAAVSRLRREIDRLSELVTALLQVTTAEGDPGSIQTGDVALGELVTEVADDCRLEAEARDCVIQLSANEAIRVTGNRELLRRALENILRNAIRYSPAGAAVEVSASVNGTAVVSVRDYGPGVPAELLPKIFSPFFRVDESRDESTGGIGLGLAIAERAVRVHHGEVTAANALPGLRVSITLPSR